jgi:cytochrome c oxidase subunit IV
METTKHAKASTYVGVFFLLFVITAAEVGVTQFLHLPQPALLIVLLAMAVFKALLVAMFFMHLKYDTKWYSWLLIFPLFMALLLAVIVIIHSATF